VAATIPSTKASKGIRATVYMDAEKCHAHVGAALGGIDYEDEKTDDLQIYLFFKTEDNASSFATSLRHWNMDRSLFPIHEPTVKEMQVPRPADLKRLLSSDYKGGDSDSPCTSLADLKGPRSQHGTSIDSQTDLAQHQSVESPFWLHMGQTNPFVMHLKNKGKKYGHPIELAKDENNMLAGSGLFHQFFDGMLNKQKMNIPLVALKPAGDTGECFDYGPSNKRHRVAVIIESRDDNTHNVVGSMLKSGATQRGALQWESFVDVRDPATFEECLQWKYDHTKAQWHEADHFDAGLESDETESDDSAESS
jgi:hypothetical protein